MIKPHILERDKERFKRFLGWAAPYTPRMSIFKLRRVLQSFRLQNRWIEFPYISERTRNIYIVSGILVNHLWREDAGKDFVILLRDIHYDGRPWLEKAIDRKTSKRMVGRFSAECIYEALEKTTKL